MPKQVLDVGNCFFDHTAICELITGAFDAEVELVNSPEEAIWKLREKRFDLALVNRTLHGGRGDGVELICRIKSEQGLSEIPVMLLSDHLQYQKQAVEAGAEPGIGKSSLGSDETRRKLARFLS